MLFFFKNGRGNIYRQDQTWITVFDQSDIFTILRNLLTEENGSCDRKIKIERICQGRE